MITHYPLMLVLDPAVNEVTWVTATQCHRRSEEGMLTANMGSMEVFLGEVTAETHPLPFRSTAAFQILGQAQHWLPGDGAEHVTDAVLAEPTLQEETQGNINAEMYGHK